MSLSGHVDDRRCNTNKILLRICIYNADSKQDRNVKKRITSF